jgi:hypothetical protein
MTASGAEGLRATGIKDDARGADRRDPKDPRIVHTRPVPRLIRHKSPGVVAPHRHKRPAIVMPGDKNVDLVISKNWIWSRSWLKRPHPAVIRCSNASGFGSIFSFGCIHCRLDKPASTPGHRLSHRRESSSARTDRQKTDAIRRYPTSPSFCQSEKGWTQGSGTDRDDRHTRNVDRLAPEPVYGELLNRTEILTVFRF